MASRRSAAVATACCFCSVVMVRISVDPSLGEWLWVKVEVVWQSVVVMRS